MNQRIDIGDKFGKLTIAAVHRVDGRGNSYLCKCECGNEVILCRSHILGTQNRPANKSCGCSHDRQDGICSSNLHLYYVRSGMIRRCYDPKSISYNRYGAKGISVCDQWKESLSDFVDWSLSNGYAEGLELDRIDYTGNYCPSNCRWVDEYTQAHNKGISKNNKTGVKGVCYSKRMGMYRAYIMRFGERINLGSFRTLEEAAAARKHAEDEFVTKQAKK